MLKIKDNVDLKKLKKLGFKHKTLIHYYCEDIKCSYWRYEFDDGSNDGINIFSKDCDIELCRVKKRIIYVMDNICSYIESPIYDIPNIFYDLINSGLVEKVKE